jgi:hypothetical protein
MSEVREPAPIIAENASSGASLQSAGSETGTMEIVVGLCGICSNIFRNLDLFIRNASDESWSSHHKSVLELRRSAENGCNLCALFVSDHNYAYSSVPPVDDLEIEEGNSEIDSETSKADQEIGREDPERDSESNEGDTDVDDFVIGDMESLDSKSGSNIVENPYAKQEATERIHFTIYQGKYAPQGHLTWSMRDAENDDAIFSIIQLSPALTPGL